MLIKIFVVGLFSNVVNALIPQIGDDYHSQKEADHPDALVICFVFLSLGIGSVFKEINKITNIPYTPMLFLVGIAWGYYYKSLGIVGKACFQISQIDPHGILIIFLPVLIYESGYNFEWHMFKRQSGQIMILAFPCLIVLCFFFQFSIKVILGYGDDYYTWESAFMFGSIISCTDTIAVLALLKDCGASKKFTYLIEGESLLNDASCMVLFTISYGIVKGGSADPVQIISLFAQLTFGGLLLGLVIGVFCVYWIKKIFNDEILVLNITIISCYFVFFIAENVSFGIKISGIISLVSISLFMSAFGRTRISHEADRAIHEFWEYVVYASETVIFLLGGIIVAIRVLKDESEITTLDFYKLIPLWGCAFVGRFMSIGLFMHWLKKWGYGLVWKEVIVLAYGGLRGAVGITFALIVAKDESLDEKLKDIILFQTSGVAFLTLVVNGTTLSLLIKLLGLSTQSVVREKLFAGFLERLNCEIDEQCKRNLGGKYLKEANWNKVKTLSGYPKYEQMFKKISTKVCKVEKQLKDIQMKNMSKSRLLDEDQDETEQTADLLVEVRRTFIVALKGIYFNLFSKNQCSPDSLILLRGCANLDLDNEREHINSWNFIYGQFSERYINALLHMKDWFILGRIAKSYLFSYIFSIYDVVSSYIEALEILKGELNQFDFSEQLLLQIIKECENNKQKAVSYLRDYLEVSFPDISKELHTKKAAFQIIEFEKQLLKNNLETGQLDEKQYMRMKKSIDDRVDKLNDMNPRWDNLHVKFVQHQNQN